MTILDRVPLERIGEQAHQVDLARALLSLLALPFLAVGFAAAVLWSAAGFAWAAVGVGWDAGRIRTRPAPPAEAAPRARAG